MKPYYQDDACTIYHGDCREILPGLEMVDLVLTDPPYGIKRFEKGIGMGDRFVNKSDGCFNNDKPDKEFLNLILKIGKHSIIWGYNNLELPISEYFLVWEKRQPLENFADAELAYTDLIVPAKIFRYGIHKHTATKPVTGHPTQKPLSLFIWCIGLDKSNPQTILDPFMGSGTTLRAAKDLRRKAIGIEIEEKYCEIAAKRLAQEVLTL